MLAAAGVQSVDELPAIEASAARAQTLRRELAELQGQVQDAGEAPFAELCHRASISTARRRR